MVRDEGQGKVGPGNALGQLVIEIFRLNGSLLAAGDKLADGLSLTSARWQVIGAIAVSERPLSVAQIGRAMGLTRQAVQRLVNELATDGLVTFDKNPDHLRAKFVVLTRDGKRAFRAVMTRQDRWAREVAALTHLGDQRLRAMTFDLTRLRRGVDAQMGENAT